MHTIWSLHFCVSPADVRTEQFARKEVMPLFGSLTMRSCNQGNLWVDSNFVAFTKGFWAPMGSLYSKELLAFSKDWTLENFLTGKQLWHMVWRFQSGNFRYWRLWIRRLLDDIIPQSLSFFNIMGLFSSFIKRDTFWPVVVLDHQTRWRLDALLERLFFLKFMNKPPLQKNPPNNKTTVA